VTLPSHGVQGQIIRIGRSVDASTQSAMAVAEITTGAGRIRPGLAVSASVAIERDGAGGGRNWSVPAGAVVRHRDQSWVFAKANDGFRARPVQVVTEAAHSVTVRGDLNANDQVAARGVLALLTELIEAEKED
jgi:hypothetical protein